MKYKVYFEEADSVRQARGRFASAAARDDDFTFIEAIKLIVGVELCENQQ